MPNNSNVCCVFGCYNSYENTKGLKPPVLFYRFPCLSWQEERRKKWIEFTKRKNQDGTPFIPLSNNRICSRHFDGNRRNENPNHPGFNPKFFCVEQRIQKCEILTFKRDKKTRTAPDGDEIVEKMEDDDSYATDNVYSVVEIKTDDNPFKIKKKQMINSKKKATKIFINELQSFKCNVVGCGRQLPLIGQSENRSLLLTSNDTIEQGSMPHRLYSFPREFYRRQAWIRAATGRDDWIPTEDSRVCSLHFEMKMPSNNPGDTDWAPSIAIPKCDAHNEIRVELMQCDLNSSLTTNEFLTRHPSALNSGGGNLNRSSLAPNMFRISPKVSENTFCWTEHHDLLAKGVENFMKRGFQADINLTYGDEQFKVHRLILSIFLPSVKKMLETSELSALITQLDLNNLASSPDDVRALIEFIYTGETTVQSDRLEYLRNLSKALNFDGFLKTIDQLGEYSAS